MWIAWLGSLGLTIDTYISWIRGGERFLILHILGIVDDRWQIINCQRVVISILRMHLGWYMPSKLTQTVSVCIVLLFLWCLYLFTLDTIMLFSFTLVHIDIKLSFSYPVRPLLLPFFSQHIISTSYSSSFAFLPFCFFFCVNLCMINLVDCNGVYSKDVFSHLTCPRRYFRIALSLQRTFANIFLLVFWSLNCGLPPYYLTLSCCIPNVLPKARLCYSRYYTLFWDIPKNSAMPYSEYYTPFRAILRLGTIKSS